MIRGVFDKELWLRRHIIVRFTKAALKRMEGQSVNSEVVRQFRTAIFVVSSETPEGRYRFDMPLTDISDSVHFRSGIDDGQLNRVCAWDRRLFELC